MSSIKHEQLISVVSDYLDKEITNLKSEHQSQLANVKSEHQSQLANLKSEHQSQLANVKSEQQEEITRLKNKLTNMVQTDDINKFQKRTIASLTAEVSTMQATITSLEKRLKMASDDLRALKQPGATPPLATALTQRAPILPPSESSEEEIKSPQVKESQPQPELESQPQPELQSQPQPESQSEPQPESEPPVPENDDAELIPVVLQSGTYFWDPDSNDLYEFLSDEEAGEVVGFIKSVKIKNQIYYLDTTDNNFYEMLDEGSGAAGAIGQHLGQIVDKKAVFLRHK